MDFTLYEISKIMYRKDRDEGMSILEQIVSTTETYYKKLRNRELYVHLNNQQIKKSRNRIESGDSIDVDTNMQSRKVSSSCESSEESKIKSQSKVSPTKSKVVSKNSMSK